MSVGRAVNSASYPLSAPWLHCRAGEEVTPVSPLLTKKYRRVRAKCTLLMGSGIDLIFILYTLHSEAEFSGFLNGAHPNV